MTTVFSDELFKKTTLSSLDDSRYIVVTVRQANRSQINNLFGDTRNDFEGVLVGRLIDPPLKPVWLVPRTVLKGVLHDGTLAILTLESVIQSRVQGVEQELGSRVVFTYYVSTEFDD